MAYIHFQNHLHLLNILSGPLPAGGARGAAAPPPPPRELFQKYFSVDFPENLRVATKS